MTQLFDNTLAGNAKVLVAKFKDRAGNPFDPEVVTVTMVQPNGTQTVFSSASSQLDNPAPGQWELVYSFTTPGLYRWLFLGTTADPVRAVAEDGRMTVVPFA